MQEQTILIVPRPVEAPAISIEQVIQRKVQRRRRVAKRKLKAVPLFAVEEMQGEFPGYTLDEFIADVTRKTRKGKSFRRPKPKAFDWREIRKEIPDFFMKCVERTKTKAVIRGRLLKSELDFVMVIRSTWFDGSGQRRLRTGDLVGMWRNLLATGSILEFHKHPSTLIYKHKNDFFNATGDNQTHADGP